jgi:hypothetical protein
MNAAGWTSLTLLGTLLGSELTIRSAESKARFLTPAASSEGNDAPVTSSRSFPVASALSVPADPLPAAVDLRPDFQRRGLAERRQGSRGTCSAFTMVGAIEFAVVKRQGRTPRLSVEFLNWAANQTCGDSVDGAFFSDLWRGFLAHGICAENDMPYGAHFDPLAQPDAAAVANAESRLRLGLRLRWIKEWDVKTGITEPQFVEIKRTLARGWPVCAGSRWPNETKWVDGVLQMCPTNAVYDGHSVLLAGYRDDPNQPGGGVFLFRNTAGDGRDGSMSYAYARAFVNDAAWVEYGPTPAAHPLSPGSWNPSHESPIP